MTINGLVRWTIGRGLAGLEAWAGHARHRRRRHLRQRALRRSEHRRPRHGVMLGRHGDGRGRDVEPRRDGVRLRHEPAAAHAARSLVWAEFGVDAGRRRTRLRATARASLAYRKRTQPLALPSAAASFRIPIRRAIGVPDGHSGVGRRARRSRRAQGTSDRRRARFRPTHANFVVNDGQRDRERHSGARSRRRAAAVRERFGVDAARRSRVPGARSDMADLVIHGGRRLSGRDRRRGQQERGAAAAGRVPADDRDLRAPERAADSRRRGDDRAAAIARRRRSRATGTTTLRDHLPRHHVVRAGSASGRPAARVGAAARRAARPHRARDARAAGRRLSRAPHDHDASARAASRWARASSRRRRATSSRRPTACTARRCICSKRRSPARKRRCWPRRRRQASTEIRQRRLRAARRRAVRVPGGAWARASTASARRRSASSRPIGCAARRTRCAATTSKPASWGVVGAITGGDVEVTGAHAEDLEPITAVLAEMELDFDLEDDRFAVRPSIARRRAPHHHRPLARRSRATSSAS